MRFTVVIDDELLKQARRRAHQECLSLSDYVEGALRRDLARPAPQPVTAVPVFRGGSGLAPGVDLTSNRAIAKFLDDSQEGRRFSRPRGVVAERGHPDVPAPPTADGRGA